MINITERIQTYGLNKILTYLEADYEKNIPRIVKWLKHLDREGEYATAYKLAPQFLSDPDNNWNQLVRRAFTDLGVPIRKMILENFVVRSAIVGNRKRKKIARREGCNVPWAILMDPTSSCNLNCIGCWAAEYGNRLSLNLDTLDRIIKEGKELGIYMYIYSGGEPLVRKKDIITLCEKHPECAFLAFTNGTLIDEKFADEMKRVVNFVPAISVEGFEEETDSRRGKGTYQAVIRAMEILKERKLLFGISSCYTSQNVDVVGSDEYIDAMIANGAKFCWYFTYMPVGKDARTDLMASAEQREWMYHTVRRFREEKPIFALDFWNDGQYVDGCIGGGRHYLHINANGDVEPCAFIHYSNVNIKDVSLLDALKSSLFMEYRKGQPFNDNHLRPCPLLDNQGKLAEMVKQSDAHSTDIAYPEDVEILTAKCKDAADRWEETAQKLWDMKDCYNCKTCK